MTDVIKKPLISLIAIFLIGVAADQGTKQWAYHTLPSASFHKHTDDYPACGTLEEEYARARFIRNNTRKIEVVKNLWDFRYVENCASAFGLMGNVPEGFRFPFFLIISILACFIIPYMYLKTPPDQKLMIYALPFIMAGALGNLLDRMIYRFVIDFVDWYVVIKGVPNHWPTFNIADVAIVVGIGLMLLHLFIDGKNERARKKAEEAKPETP